MAEWREELDRRCAQALDAATRDVVEGELVEHLQDRFDELVAAGEALDAADRRVCAELPGVDAIRQLGRRRVRFSTPAPAPAGPETDDRLVARVAGGLTRDLRGALRAFGRARTFTAAAILTIAVGLAANVAVFAIVNAVLFEALTVSDPQALIQIGNLYPNAGSSASDGGNSGVPDYFDRRRDVPALAQQALFRVHGVSVGDDAAERLVAMTATPSLFPMLGVEAALGRTFTDDEGESGHDQRVVLSDALWRRRFAAAPDAVGRSLLVGGVPHQIVGVMPRDFRFHDDEVTLWLPAAFALEERADAARHSNNWTHVGRLAPGATLADVQQQVDRLNAANLERFPALKAVLIEAGFRSEARPVVEVLTAPVQRPLALLWAGVGAVLLIAVVNLAALTLARGTARRGELATRLALGASPWRVRTQLLTEHVLLAVVGGTAGAALAWALVRALPAANLSLVPAGRVVLFAPAVWTYAAGLTVVVGLALGLVAMTAVDPARANEALRDEGRNRSGSRGTRRLRQALVVAQVALACTLLVVAGVLFASFQRMLAVETGFRAGVVTGAVSLPEQAYPDDAARLGFTTRLLTAVRALPGVTAAGATTSIPFGSNRGDSVAWPEGWTPSPGESFVSPYQIRVSDGYFEAMGIPVEAGRTFDGRDIATSEPVVIVDARLAERFWPGRDPIGRYLLQPTSPEALSHPTPDNLRRYRVVGVVAAVKLYALVTPVNGVGVYYFPFAQQVPGGFTLAVQSGAAASTVGADLRRVLAGLDPRLPLFDVRVMQARVDESLRARRATMALTAAFSALALGLSALGLYGVLAYLVALRTREIGIRMALGGTAPAIAALVVRESLTVVLVGLSLGLAGAAWAGRAIATELVDVRPMEPTVVGTAIGLLIVAAVVATAAPARRALKVDPAVALASD